MTVLATPEPGKWTEVATGVFCYRCTEFRVNAGLVVGADAALLVDTGASAAQGWALLEAARLVTSAPVDAVVTTHAHFDHCFGTEAFPGAEVFAHRGAASVLRATAEEQRAAVIEWRPELAADLETTSPVIPERLVDDERELWVGGRRVLLIHPGRGHTDHDLMVAVPDADLVFSGDVVEEGGEPAFGDSWPVEWPLQVDQLLSAEPGIVVCGHGKPMDTDQVRGWRSGLQAVVDLYRSAARGDIGREQAYAASPFSRSVTLAAFYRLSRTREESDERLATR